MGSNYFWSRLSYLFLLLYTFFVIRKRKKGSVFYIISKTFDFFSSQISSCWWFSCSRSSCFRRLKTAVGVGWRCPVTARGCRVCLPCERVFSCSPWDTWGSLGPSTGWAFWSDGHAAWLAGSAHFSGSADTRRITRFEMGAWCPSSDGSIDEAICFIGLAQATWLGRFFRLNSEKCHRNAGSILPVAPESEGE